MDTYSSLYEIVSENLMKAHQVLPFSAELVSCFADNPPNTCDLDELRKESKNEKFFVSAYAALLHRLPKEKEENVWKNRYKLPQNMFQDLLLTTILDSQEFKQRHITVAGKMPVMGKRFFAVLFAVKHLFDKVKRGIRYVLKRAMQRLLFSRTQRAFARNGKRDVILTADLFLEGMTAPQDGFELFKYFYNKPEGGYKPYYLINRDNAEYRQIKNRYGKHIIAYSIEKSNLSKLRLIRYFKKTKFLCSGYKVMPALSMGISEAIKKSPDVYNIFMQHGVNFFKEDFITPSTYSAFFFDKIMVSNDYERQLFLKRGCMREENLIRNGLLRWDQLETYPKPPEERSIFVYFTHRRYLKLLADAKSSVYVQTIIQLLENKELNDLLSSHKYKLKVAVHHTVANVFGKELLSGIQLVSDDEIAQVKREADLLITDYSSMCFEMWFQHKPVIFYHIDDDFECLKFGHGTDLAYPYRGKEQLIPNIANSEAECVQMLKHYFETDMRLTEREENIRRSFFYYDSDFCERLSGELQRLSQTKKEMSVFPYDQEIWFNEYADLTVDGISGPNKNGRWISRKRASLGLYLPAVNNSLAVSILGSPALGKGQKSVQVEIFVNNHHVRQYTFTKKRNERINFEIPRSWLPEDGYVNIAFRIPHCKRYCDITNSKDQRRLSVNLKTIFVTERDSFYSLDNQLKYALKSSAASEESEVS